MDEVKDIIAKINKMASGMIAGYCLRSIVSMIPSQVAQSFYIMS
jgi:hypothetical protein